MCHHNSKQQLSNKFCLCPREITSLFFNTSSGIAITKVEFAWLFQSLVFNLSVLVLFKHLLILLIFSLTVKESVYLPYKKPALQPLNGKRYMSGPQLQFAEPPCLFYYNPSLKLPL